jgi:hypothetical protein
MDPFSMLVLESTLELAAEVITSERVRDDVKVIRGYIDLISLEPTNSEYVHKLRQALADLSDVATQNQHFFIVARLNAVVGQLGIQDVA